MRQVDQDELAYVLTTALRHISRSTRHQLLDARIAVRKQGEARVGIVMAEALARHEVLSAAPAANTSFGVPMDRLLGYDVEGGAVKLD